MEAGLDGDRAPAERAAPEPTDLVAVASDVLGLERMGAGDEVQWILEGSERPAVALARKDELKEVLLNVFENARHAHAIQEARRGLQDARDKLARSEPIELLASDLRNALAAFGEVLGKIDNERMLDQLFASFCIGK